MMTSFLKMHYMAPRAGACLLLFYFLAPFQALQAQTETVSYESIQKLFQAGFYDVAQGRAEIFLKSNSSNERAKEVRLIDAQCLYYMGQYDAALNMLKPLTTVISSEKLVATALYWQAESFVALQEWKQAESVYRQVIQHSEGEKFRDDARLGLAWSLFKQGQAKEMSALLDELTKKDASSLTTQKAKLLQGKIQVSNGELAQSQKTLSDLLNSQPRPTVLFEAAYFLGEVYSTKKDYARAVEAYKKITENSQATPKSLVAYSHYGLGNALVFLNQTQDAQNSFYQTFLLADKEQLKITALDRYLNCALLSNNLLEATKRIRDWATKNGDRSYMPIVLVRTASFLRENNKSELSIALLKDYAAVLDKPAIKYQAQLELGRAYRTAGQAGEALKALNAGLAGMDASNSGLASEYEYELGATKFELKKYPEAAQHFSQLAAKKDKLEQHAQIGLLFTLAAQKNLDEFIKNERSFKQNFPTSKYTDQVQLLHGWLLENLGKIKEAKAIYEKALTSTADSTIKAQFLFQLASLLTRSGELEKAEPLYEQFTKEYPQHPLYPDAAAQLILALAKEKKIPDQEIPGKLQEIWEKNKQTTIGPKLLFELAEYYYNAQDYTNAHNFFAEFLKNYPFHAFATEAAYWGGLAAANHNDYSAAVSLFEKIPDLDERKTAARILQGKLYQKQLLFENALTIYDSILSTVKSGPQFAELELLKGNCLFALGEKYKQNFELSLVCYQRALSTMEATADIKNEAAFRRGKTLEKLGRTPEALAVYLDVLLGDKSTSAGPTTRELVWRSKAGLEAARMKEETKDWQGAIEIYKQLEKLGGPDQLHYKEVINRIRRNNYFYE